MRLGLILASSSAIRRQMLASAGVEFEALPAGVDEARIKSELSAADEIAARLAAEKAKTVSALHTGDWVIGSDSVVSVDGRLFDKPRSRDEAAGHLRFFSGKLLKLTSAVALARGGELHWCQVDAAMLQVRSLSNAFVATYLDAEWPDVAYCVGVFRLEGRGVQLFDRIDGNYFTVLGMPLLHLLAKLREIGCIAS